MSGFDLTGSSTALLAATPWFLSATTIVLVSQALVADGSADQEVIFCLGRQEDTSVVEETVRFIQVRDQWRRKPEVRLVKDGE